MYRHDLSEFREVLPHPDGTFRDEWLRSALGDPGWAAHLAFLGNRPAGFALVRGLDAPARVLNSFFIVRGARRGGWGTRLALEVIAAHPGPWEIAFQEANARAARFWRRVAGQVAGDAWTEAVRPVLDQPGLPGDVWIVIR
ncbi:GNAT family N-acetyltransferase [Streptomyces sp. NPDC037389]|uniref:GNAT family N-acetyltransferase n=1 Tax=Streptomyces sp. NPDC037389 TaxID=3155369 RepID=UPI003407FFED